MKTPLARHEQKIRYLIGGIYNTIFGYLAFVALLLVFERSLHYLIVLVISHVISVANAFIVYRRFVFKSTGRVLFEYLRFNLVYLIAFIFNIAALPFLVEIARMTPMKGQAAITVVTVILSYVGHKYFSFK